MSDGNRNRKHDKNAHAETVIRNHVFWSMGTSFIIPIPVADVFAVSALQLDMIRQLCRVYELDFAETRGKAIVSALTTSSLTRVGARSFIKLIPGVGQLIGGVAVSIFNGASTYALGEVFKAHFNNGGTILDFDVERLKKVYNDKFEKGKKVVKQWEKEAKEVKDDVPDMADDYIRPEDDTTPEPSPSEAPAPTPTPNVKVSPKTADDVLARLRELGDLRNQGLINDEEFEQMKRKLIDEF